MKLLPRHMEIKALSMALEMLYCIKSAFICLCVCVHVNHSSGYLLPHPDGAGNKQGYAVGPLNRTV